MFSRSRISVESHPQTDRPFYLPGDVVRGRIELSVASTLTYSDVQVKLKCIEQSVVESDGNQMKFQFEAGVRQSAFGPRLITKRKLPRPTERRPTSPAGSNAAYQDEVRHFEMTTNVRVREARPHTDKALFTLDKGHYTLAFELLLPETVKRCPPACAVAPDVGIKWLLKVVVHRPGLAPALREEVPIPVFPTPELHGRAASPLTAARLDWAAQTELKGFKAFRDSRKPRRVRSSPDVKASFAETSAFELVAKLRYPTLGIAQGPLHTPLKFSLVVEASREPMTITHVRLSLLLVCITTIDNKALENTLVKQITLKDEAIDVPVNPRADLSKAVGNVSPASVLPPEFTSNMLKVSYKLRLELSCSAPGLGETSKRLQLETPVSVVPPELCWLDPPALPRYEDVAQP